MTRMHIYKQNGAERGVLLVRWEWGPARFAAGRLVTVGVGERPKQDQKWFKKGQKGVKRYQKRFKRHLGLHQIASKHSKSTQDPSRHTHLLHTFIG